MAFHDVRLPIDIERGAVGGPMFHTTVFSADSGEEQRNSKWAQVRGEWDVGYGLMQKFDDGVIEASVEELGQFFYPKRGRAHSFRFKAWDDFDIGNQASPLATAQQIGLGDDAQTVFPIFKRYTSGGINFDRFVYLIVAGTISVYLDGVLQTDPGDYTVNLLTGDITMGTPPASTGGTGPGSEELLAVTTQFDNHVRFDTDHLQISMRVFSAGSWPNIPIIGLRGAGA